MAAPTLTEVEHRPVTGFRADVQALRAVAVLLVVLYHAGVPGLSGGFIGVDVFFVIAGFLITGTLMRERAETGTISVLDFYGRRLRRVMPVAALVLIVTVLGAYRWLGFIHGAMVAEDAEWSAVFLANFHFAEVGGGSPLQHFWSLAVGAQLLVVWPLVVLLRSRKQIILILVVASYAVFAAAPDGYLSPLTRAWEFGAGALLALAAAKQQHRARAGAELPRRAQAGAELPQWAGVLLCLTGLAALVGAAFTITDATGGWVVAVPVLATCAVLAGGSAIEGTPLDRAFRVLPVRFIGLWSYGLYLWHWPILTIAWERLGHAPTPGVTAFLVLGSVALSALTFYAIEQPARRLKNPVLSIALGLALSAAVVLLSVTKVMTT